MQTYFSNQQDKEFFEAAKMPAAIIIMPPAIYVDKRHQQRQAANMRKERAQR
jgi:hypothetical protein